MEVAYSFPDMGTDSDSFAGIQVASFVQHDPDAFCVVKMYPRGAVQEAINLLGHEWLASGRSLADYDAIEASTLLLAGDTLTGNPKMRILVEDLLQHGWPESDDV